MATTRALCLALLLVLASAIGPPHGIPHPLPHVAGGAPPWVGAGPPPWISLDTPLPVTVVEAPPPAPPAPPAPPVTVTQTANPPPASVQSVPVPGPTVTVVVPAGGVPNDNKGEAGSGGTATAAAPAPSPGATQVVSGSGSDNTPRAGPPGPGSGSGSDSQARGPGGNPFSGGAPGSGGSDGNPFAGGNGDGSNGGRGGENGFGPDGGFGFLGFDVNKAMYVRTVHGILATIAFLGIFPIGAIVMRVVPGRLTVWIHGLIQLAGLAIFIAAAALGIYLAKTVNIRGASLFNVKEVNFHLIIGLVVLAGLCLQPIFGLVHHIRYKKVRHRQVWSHFHLWIGRLFVSLGIVNGGLGLWVANASQTLKISYAVVASIIWFVWLLVAVGHEVRRTRPSTKSRTKRERLRDQTSISS